MAEQHTHAQGEVWNNINEHDLDQINIGMRGLPWYQETIRSFGQDPAHPHLNDAQARQLQQVALQHGFSAGDDIEMDKGGNWDTKGHGLRNTLIGLAIGGAALTGLGAAGIGPLSGVFGGATAAGGAGVGIGETAATTGIAGPVAGLGVTAAPAIGGGSMAAGGGLLGGAKTAYDIYKKGKGVYDTVSGALPGISEDLSKIEQGRAEGRLKEAEQARLADQNRIRMAEFNRQNPGVRAGDAVRGDTLANLQDFKLSGSGRDVTGTGGLRPSLMSQGTRDLGKEMARQEYISQMGQGGEKDPYAFQKPTETPQAGALDTALTTGSLVSKYLPLGKSAIDFFRKRNGPLDEALPGQTANWDEENWS